MIYFPTELIFGAGVWLIWLALVSDPARSTAGVVRATLLLGAVMAFTHPALALMGLFFVAAGLALPLFGQRLPTRSLAAVAVLSVALLAFYLAAAHWLPPTNPTDGASQETNRFAYRLSNTSKSIRELTRDGKAILLDNALIETGVKINLPIPKNLRSQGDPGAYIVQARGLIAARFRALQMRLRGHHRENGYGSRFDMRGKTEPVRQQSAQH